MRQIAENMLLAVCKAERAIWKLTGIVLPALRKHRRMHAEYMQRKLDIEHWYWKEA